MMHAPGPGWFYKLKRALRTLNRSAQASPSQRPDQFTLAGGRVLVIAPHPDDEVIGCGGTLRRHVLAGEPVKIVYLTGGGASNGFPWLSAEQKILTRHDEAQRGCQRLGITDLTFFDGPDGQLSQPAAMNQYTHQLAELLRAFRPARVYVPHALDAHQDHHAAYQMLQSALPVSGCAADVWQYEVWNTLHPQLAVDITPYMPLKRAAIGEHRLALDAFDYVATMTALATYRSGTLLQRRGYAEAFAR